MAVVRTRSKGRLLAAAVVALLAAGLLWGITGALASSESPSPAAGKTILRLGWTNDPDNLNPFIGYESSSYEVWAINYELLVGFRASDYANVPGVGLATDWQTSDDGKVWTFTITDKSRWQDGEPLTAKDVAFTYNYVIENELGMFLDYVKFIEKVEAPDATHVVFTCSKPKANMLGLWMPILPEHIWSKVKPSEVENKFTNPPPIIGSGPFQTVEWKKGEYVRMVANKDYWRGAPKVDEVIFQTYQNQDTMAQDLKSGAIQSGWNIPSAQVDPLNNEPDLEAIRGVVVGCRRTRLQLRRQEGLPQVHRAPGASGPGLPQRPAVGRGQGQDRLHRLQRQRRPRGHDLHQRLLRGRGRLPPHATRLRTPSTSTRRARRSTRPATSTATATASASTRARTSSCACTRAPSPPRARTAASSSPAGSRRSAWTSTTRSSTTARSATSSTTTTATSMRRTSTCSSGAGAATSTPTSSCPS